MNEFSVPPNYVASLQESLTDDVLRSPIGHKTSDQGRVSAPSSVINPVLRSVIRT
jgi:hypothetical protein